MLDLQANSFAGVRFALFGFDPIKHDQVRSRLVSVGGVDVGQYGPGCTHVIVDKLVYDDPICAAARRDGKALVNSLWIDHSLDVGMPVDAFPIMYRPVKDFNGIPGAKSFVMCLTGYQRHDRDDIMTLVSLMGAQFSKPLVANRVTHLICYKFEGEKYELAKKMKKIKLINHRWLEDCLKAWEVLPEENYCKSGYELEMEPEAQDSEEETLDRNVTLIRGSPHNLQNKSPVNQNTPVTERRLLNAESVGLSHIVSTKDVTPPIKLENQFDRAMKSNNGSRMGQLEPRNMDNGGISTPKSGNLLNEHDTAPLAKGFGADPPSASASAKRLPNENAVKLSGLSCTSKTSRRSSLSLHPRGASSNKDTPIEHLAKGRDSPRSCIPPSKEDCGNVMLGHVSLEAPSNGSDVSVEVGSNCSLKRKMNDNADFSPPRFKYQKPNASDSKQNAVEETSVSMDGSFRMSKNASVDSPVLPTMNAAVTPDHRSDKSPSSPEKISSETNLPISKILISDMANVSARSSSFAIAATSSVMGTDEQQNQQHFISSPAKYIEAVKSRSPKSNATRDPDSSIQKSTRKSLSKKTLGSRAKLNTRNSANQKGSIFLGSLDKENASPLADAGVGEANDVNIANTCMPVTILPCDNPDKADASPVDDIFQSANQADANPQSLDEDTEPPLELERLQNAAAEDNGTITDEIQHEVGVCNEKLVQDASAGERDPRKPEFAKEEKLVTTKSEESPALARVLEPKTPVDEHNTEVGKITVKNRTGKRKRVLQPLSNTRHGMKLMKKLQQSSSHEKENLPVIDDELKNTSNVLIDNAKSAAKSRETAKKSTQRAVDVNSRSLRNLHVLGKRKAPAWFILSGRRLQRKEYQRVIKKLKGRLCRDSHQWSYQATHFIAPDPIRRTEKFFAAAASGSWVLKTNYLTASNEAGKFLPEEPYEWHKNGLSDDGAINLEAPRKWRLLRERTGHGAFHGMRIVIYGDCIVPTLDTLKRVIRAGDGTILATSPPYSRFLKTEVHFAIVSPGIPHADAWVQEFLRHEVPCVLVDYLVEYVCKPGHSFEKHVQYNTHTWAAKSLAKLVDLSEEVVESPCSTPDDQVNDKDDLACQVCGSADRGEIMLICGDESGSVGCGIGTHIDCCDPPLEKVPEEDWFCPKCRDDSIRPSRN